MTETKRVTRLTAEERRQIAEALEHALRFDLLNRFLVSEHDAPADPPASDHDTHADHDEADCWRSASADVDAACDVCASFGHSVCDKCGACIERRRRATKQHGAAIRAEGLDVERVTDETRGVMRAMERLRTDIQAELASVGRSHDEPVWKQGAQAAYQWVLARLAEAERSKPSFDPFALDSIPDD